MKRILVLAMLVLSLFVIAGCNIEDLKSVSVEDVNKVIKCEEPYIRFGTGCCLDKDDNKICDNDEGKTNTNTDNCKEIDVPYETTETYTEDEVYTEKVPYQATECNDVQVPYTTTEQMEQTLFSAENKFIDAGGAKLIYTLNLKEDVTVHVTFSADGTLNLWAFDADEFEKIQRNSMYVSDQYLLKREGVSSADASFKTTTDGTYVIYLVNPHMFGGNIKIFSFDATASWDEQVTKTKTERKCNTVTKYKNEEKTKTVTKTRPVVKYKKQTVC